MIPRAGERLRQLRTQLGLTTREVADLSRRIAQAESNEEFAVSHARLIQIENDESTPSVYKLFTLSTIYAQPFTEVVALYVNLESISKYQLTLRLENTRLANFDPYLEERPVSFPVRFDPGFKLEKTNLIARMVEIWGEVPIGLLQQAQGLHHVPFIAAGFVGPNRRPAEGADPRCLPIGIRPPDLVSGAEKRLRMLLVRNAAGPDCLDPPSSIPLPDAGVCVPQRSRDRRPGDRGGGPVGQCAGATAGSARRASRAILILDVNNSTLRSSQALGMSTR